MKRNPAEKFWPVEWRRLFKNQANAHVKECLLIALDAFPWTNPRHDVIVHSEPHSGVVDYAGTHLAVIDADHTCHAVLAFGRTPDKHDTFIVRIRGAEAEPIKLPGIPSQADIVGALGAALVEIKKTPWAKEQARLKDQAFIEGSAVRDRPALVDTLESGLTRLAPDEIFIMSPTRNAVMLAGKWVFLAQDAKDRRIPLPGTATGRSWTLIDALEGRLGT